MNFLEFGLFLVVLIPSVSLHELFHGWTAYRLGDPTAKLMGRLTLNPIAHIDPIGTLLLPFLMFLFTGFVFGYAKPVPINPANLHDPKRDMILIGLSGPAANFLLALVFSLMIKAGLLTGLLTSLSIIYVLLRFGIIINLILAIFNLVPIPPLDGSRVLMGVLPHHLAVSYSKLEPYGFLIIVGLLYLGIKGKIIFPVINFLTMVLL